MKPSSLELSFLLASSATADFLTARSPDHGHFYATLEQSSSRFETLDDIDSSALELAGLDSDRGHSLVSRENQCTELTGITKMICDNMPSRWTFWAFGGPRIIYYAPRLITNWLNDIAVTIQAGRNLRRVWRDGSSGANGLALHDELKRTLNMKAREDTASSWSLTRRFDDIEGVFSESDQVLSYNGTSGAFSFGAPEGKGKSRLGNSTLELEARAPTTMNKAQTVQIRSVSLAETEPSTGWRLQEFSGENSHRTKRF
ncbi:hypothetical protein BDW72DRAFT_207675 [Aspergillus terricola var. indicus]